MQFLKSPLVVAVAASMLILAGCNADKDAKSATPAAKAEVVATVNGTPISKGSVDMIVKQGEAQKQQDTPEARDAITNQLIMQTLIAEIGRASCREECLRLCRSRWSPYH